MNDIKLTLWKLGSIAVCVKDVVEKGLPISTNGEASKTGESGVTRDQ